MKCTHCRSEMIRKNGTNRGVQRYICKDCGKTFSAKPPRFSKDTKYMAMLMYLNNVGIRKIALFTGSSPPAVVKWIKKGRVLLEEMFQNAQSSPSKDVDIIEFDEIYTYVKKNGGKQLFGLLTLGEKSVLLHLKSVSELMRP